MFQPGAPLIEIVLRTVLVYVALLLGLRVAGKREIGQMTVFDLVVLLLIANAVQNAMVGPDNSLTGGVLAALTLLLLNFAIARLRLRVPWLRHWVDGSPTLLVLHGETIDRNLNREGIDTETLSAALREHGLGDIKEVEMAVLEIDGSISIISTREHTRTVKHPKSLLKK